MEDLKLLIVQPDILWKDIAGNLKKYDNMLQKQNPDTDLILFPEMFQTGFCTEPEDVAESMQGTTIRWMKDKAALYGCSIAGSMIIKENRRYFNRMIYIDQYGNLTWYDKRHLYTVEGEEKKYTAGMSRLIIPLKNWQISFQICYDLRFPVWARNRNDYDVLINLASWPSNRRDVWTTLLTARAMENQSYVIGVNRTGKDDNNFFYTGNSLVIDPKGMIIGELQDSHEGFIQSTLSWEFLDNFRNKFPVWKDWDNFEIKI